MRNFFILFSFSILFCLMSCSPEHEIREDMEVFVKEFAQSDSCESVVHDSVFIYNVAGKPNYLLDEEVQNLAVSYAFYTTLKEVDDWGALESLRGVPADSVKAQYRKAIREVRPKECLIPDEGIWVLHELTYKKRGGEDDEQKFFLYIFDVSGRRELAQIELGMDHFAFEKMLEVSDTVYDPEAEWWYYSVLIGYTVIAYFVGGCVLLLVWIKRKKTRKH